MVVNPMNGRINVEGVALSATASDTTQENVQAAKKNTDGRRSYLRFAERCQPSGGKRVCLPASAREWEEHWS